MNNTILDHTDGKPLDIPSCLDAKQINNRPILALPNPETANAAYMHATNLIAFALTVYIAYETKQTLTAHVMNIPVIIVGVFPIIASSAISILTFFSEKDSLLRIFYIAGIFTSSWMGV